MLGPARIKLNVRSGLLTSCFPPRSAPHRTKVQRRVVELGTWQLDLDIISKEQRFVLQQIWQIVDEK